MEMEGVVSHEPAAAAAEEEEEEEDPEEEGSGSNDELLTPEPKELVEESQVPRASGGDEMMRDVSIQEGDVDLELRLNSLTCLFPDRSKLRFTDRTGMSSTGKGSFDGKHCTKMKHASKNEISNRSVSFGLARLNKY